MLRNFLLAAALLLPAPALAKNVFDHNHPDLDWYSIETEHFVVHYPQSKKKENNKHYLTAKWTAQKSAKIAEEMYPRMSAEFNYYIKEKVHIVILNQGDDLQGFTVPTWDWIEVSANPGSDFYRMRSRMDWLYDVLVHEYAHVVSLKAQGNYAEGVQAVSIGALYNEGVGNTMTGGEVLLGNNEPWYWTEGGAEYWSDQSGYNWWTPGRDRTVRMSVLEDRLLDWDEWKTVAQTHTWMDGERGYQQGYSFGLYLRERFGSETYNKFATENQQGWVFDWNDHLEKVTGVPGPQLYQDWRAWVTKKYTEQYAAMKAEGETPWRELALEDYEWEYTDPDGRDAFNDLRWKRKWGVTGEKIARREREAAKEATGRWYLTPKWSDDGKWFGSENSGTLEINPVDESLFSAYTGTVGTDRGETDLLARQTLVVPTGAWGANGAGHDWDFVPGQDAVVITGAEHLGDDKKPGAVLLNARWEADGYEWKKLWYVPLELKEHKEGNLTYTGWKEVDVLGVKHPPMPKGAYAIPNTERGTDPAVSPDGKKIAYFEYTDATMNLVTINLDGTDKKYLSKFDDGTAFQRMDWSPDGKTIAVGIFRNFQQDIWLVDADGQNWRPLMYDRWEDNDPEYTRDGDLLFISDRTGIMQVYRWDHETNKIAQITNLIGSAETPSETPDGNLVFTSTTAHGQKVGGLQRADFLEKDVTADFVLDADPAAVKEAWEFREDLSMFKEEPYRYQLMAPSAVPLIRITNDSRDDLSLQAGAAFFVQDFIEDHFAYAEAIAGEDWNARLQYMYQGWYPNLILGGVYGEAKYPYGYLLDDDNDLSTTADQGTYEGKQSQNYMFGFGGVDYPWNSYWRSFLVGSYIQYGFRSTDDTSFAQYNFSTEVGLTQSFSSLGQWSASANPRGGRSFDIMLSRGFTDIVYEPFGGKTVDDGELLDNYAYNKAEIRWVEQIPVPAWGGLLTEANQKQHTIQLDFDVGMIDRNVDRNDEFRGGGQHPFYWGSNSLRPNTLFSGYPAYSLSGETMAMVNLAYRFPIRRYLNKHVGPLYVHTITGQVMGTAGNLWSFTPPDDPAKFYRNEYGERVAYDPADVQREIPFIDEAHKNGNYLLYDAGAELRVSSTLFDNYYWNSFVRVSYGFNEIRGYGDVNGDDISDSTESAVGDELSNETEEPGFRFYVGLGTGW
ncbi:MAG: PD40 domain-containing protein [Deltaproteobacteria bacterium]|nr:PD40 domain-containing protein [Deltaproteobacteria bacterium]